MSCIGLLVVCSVVVEVVMRLLDLLWFMVMLFS